MRWSKRVRRVNIDMFAFVQHSDHNPLDGTLTSCSALSFPIEREVFRFHAQRGTPKVRIGSDLRLNGTMTSRSYHQGDSGVLDSPNWRKKKHQTILRMVRTSLKTFAQTNLKTRWWPELFDNDVERARAAAHK